MFNFFKKKPPSSDINKTDIIESTKTVEANLPKEAHDQLTSWSDRLRQGLKKTRQNFTKQIASLFGGGKIDEAMYEELETILLSSDMGVEATLKILDGVKSRVALGELSERSALKHALKEELAALLTPLERQHQWVHKPHVILMVGVNGAGKTTSIGKIAHLAKQQGKSILLAAGDTFRAAAKEQLEEWGRKNQVKVISQTGGDAAAICFDAIQSAQSKQIDIVIADTAGRLPTQSNLMEELKKIKRVIKKALPEAPHDIYLVLDANIGQNAISQVQAFDEALGLTGLIITKLDGTAKAGILAAIAMKCPIPVHFIGVGEHMDDLKTFVVKDYLEALFD